MRLLIAYGLISFAIGTGLSSVAGRAFDIPWLFGQVNTTDPGMAMMTGFSVLALGVGVLLLNSVWRENRINRRDQP